MEDGIATKDADGTPLPDLPDSVSSAHKDILVQMDAMQAAAGTSYGSVSAPYNSKKCIVGGDMSECTVTDPVGTQSHADASGREDCDRRLQECASRQHRLAWGR